MKKYRVAIIKKNVKYLTVLAKDENMASYMGLKYMIGKDFSGCYVEYFVEGVVDANDNDLIDIISSVEENK
jgi:hypothetical protein